MTQVYIEEITPQCNTYNELSCVASKEGTLCVKNQFAFCDLYLFCQSILNVFASSYKDKLLYCISVEWLVVKCSFYFYIISENITLVYIAS